MLYRSPHLRQGLYDDGEVIMADVLVNLHGNEHRRGAGSRTGFRRDTFATTSGPLPDRHRATLAPYVRPAALSSSTSVTN